MIPQPDMSFHLFVLFFSVVLLILTSIFTMKKGLVFLFAAGIVITLSFSIVENYSFNLIWDKYESSVEDEIKNTGCVDLPASYEYYQDQDFKEKIKTKYLFDCVADKKILEMMK